MENKKYVAAVLALAILSAQSASAMELGSGYMSSGVSDAVENAQSAADSSVSTTASDSSDSDDSSSDNGDVTVSDSQVREGNYDVNGTLTVEGVLYVFGNLDVNGDLVIEKNAKLRVLGKLDVNGDVTNNGGSLYAAKKSGNGGGTNKSRKLDSMVSEIDALLSSKIVAEEREGLLQDLLDSKGYVRAERLKDFLDSLDDKIEARDVKAYEKIKVRLVTALERKIKQMGGLKDKQLDVFQTKLESMPTEKLEKFVAKIEKLEKATKKKRFAFQLAQLKELAEEMIEAREASADEPVVEVPAASNATGSASQTFSGTTASGSTQSTASGTTSQTSTGSSSTGSTQESSSGTTSQTSSGSTSSTQQ